MADEMGAEAEDKDQGLRAEELKHQFIFDCQEIAHAYYKTKINLAGTSHL